jgi:hypothetical protein
VTVERVTWTALPNHTSSEGVLRLSVFVSPRLTNDDGSSTQRKLGEFATFANWATTLGGVTFDATFDGLPDAFEGLVPTKTPEPSLWERIFPDSMPVFPFAYQDFAALDLHVFPVRPVLQFVQSVYGALAAGSSTELPSIDDPGSPIRRIADLGDLPTVMRDLPSFSKELGQQPKSPKQKSIGKGQVIVDSAGSGDAETFLQAYRFYYRPGSRRLDFPQDHQAAKPKPPELDFHRAVSLLGDQPELLRRLGLVVDLELPPGSEIPPEGRVRVSPSSEIMEGPPSPWTRYEHEGTFFGARPRDPFRFHHGLLRLSKEFFDLYQVDVDGAALKLVDFASTIGHMQDEERRSHATPSDAGAPALRSAGFGIARTGRGEQLLADLLVSRAKNDDLENELELELDLEDIVRGYRVDVLDENADEAIWRSLHHRRCTYTIGGPGGGQPMVFDHEDEAYVKGVAVSSERVDNPSPSDDLYLHEALFGWEGWSLAVSRPGKRIVEPGEGDGGGPIARHDPADESALPVVTTLDLVDRTLPRLRFGHAYRLRARAVDLAGNSLPPSEDELGPPNEELTIGPRTYLRFEPVPSPTVLRQRLDTEGESLEHVVIRSTAELDAAAYAADPAVVAALAAAGAEHAYFADSNRHLAPPKSSQQMAELLERFEPAFGSTAAAATAALRVALREEGTFLDPLIVDIQTGKKTIPQVGQTLHPTSASLPAVRGAGLAPGEYVHFTGGSVLLPYLPDPLAVGVAITGFDVFGNEVFHETADFDGDWPALDPFRLRLSETTGAVSAGFEGGVLEVRLPKADVVRVHLSSIFAATDLERFAVWDWNQAKSAALESSAKAGQNWLLTPFRLLDLTHAVQRPLTSPDTTELIPTRALADTSATFHGAVKLHARSTGRVDVHATWTEDLDLVTDDLPRMRALGTEVHKEAVAFGFDLETDEDEARATINWHAQAGWRWCRRCQGLVFGAGASDPCPGGGVHDLSASGNYAVSHNDPTPEGQTGWRWCGKCQGLAYVGVGTGICPAGGVHSHVGSGSYDVRFDDPDSPGQSGWRRCLKCKLLVFASDAPGPCAAGGGHAYVAAANHELRLVTTQPLDRVSRHDFGDTKYRKVSYHGMATTRFREFFPTTITSDPVSIQTTESQVGEDDEPRPELVRHILSSARPSAPEIVYVLPTFEWARDEEDAKRTHVRKGNGVRVYLRRPWFSSGDGELLGVVVQNPPLRSRHFRPAKRTGVRRAAAQPVVRLEPVRQPPSPSPIPAGDIVVDSGSSLAFTTPFLNLPYVIAVARDRLGPYVTDWASDPVWESPEPRRMPTISDFPRHVAHATGLTLEELTPAETVAAAGHEVFFDPSRTLWYCDIDVAASSTYFPFVRLALARFQPRSLADAHLSRVVLADFVQLAPDRIATVALSHGQAAITVAGVSARNVVGEILQSKFAFDLETKPVPNTEMWAVLQAHDASIRDDLGWRSVGDPVRLVPEIVDGFHVTWKGTLGASAADERGTRRILVTETETYLRSDMVEGDPNSATSPADFVRSRIVYADEFDLGPVTPVG